MPAHAALALVLLAPAFGLDEPSRTDAIVITPEPQCELRDGGPNLYAAHQTGEVVAPGTAWWLPRRDPETREVVPLFNDDDLSLVLVAGDGTEYPVDAHVTYGSVAIPVPEDAGEGVFLLLRPGTELSRLLRVEGAAPRPTTFVLEDVALDEPDPADCSVHCYLPWFAAARRPVARLDFAGDPVIVDAWMHDVGTEPDPQAPRVIDSRLFHAPPEGDALSLFIDGDLPFRDVDPRRFTVQIRDPATLTLLHEEVTETALPTVPLEQGDLRECNRGGGGGTPPPPDPGPPVIEGGCQCTSSSEGGLLALSALALLGVRGRRRTPVA